MNAEILQGRKRGTRRAARIQVSMWCARIMQERHERTDTWDSQKLFVGRLTKKNIGVQREGYIGRLMKVALEDNGRLHWRRKEDYIGDGMEGTTVKEGN